MPSADPARRVEVARIAHAARARADVLRARRTAEIIEYVRAQVEAWPPLGARQRAAIAALLLAPLMPQPEREP